MTTQRELSLEPKRLQIVIAVVFVLALAFVATTVKAQSPRVIKEPTAEGVFYLLDSAGAQHSLENTTEKLEGNDSPTPVITIQGEHSTVRFPSDSSYKFIVRLPSGITAHFMNFSTNQGVRKVAFQRESGKTQMTSGTLVPYALTRIGSNSILVTPKEPLSAAEYCLTLSGGHTEVSCFGIDESSGVVALPGDTSKLDVAGVRLGMTPDEAMDALRKFAHWPVLKKRYEDPGARGGLSVAATVGQVWNIAKTNNSTFGFLGYSDDCIERKNIKDRLLVAIVAARANRKIYPPNTDKLDFDKNDPSQTIALRRHADPNKPFTAEELQYPAECDWRGNLLVSRPGEDPLEVAVYFSPTPGKEHVIAVSLWSSLGNSPLVETLTASALRKYGPEYSALRQSSNGDGALKTLSWRFNQDGKLYPESAVGKLDFTRANPSFYGLGMAMFNPDNGVGLDFNVLARPGGLGLAKSYSVALFDEKEIVAWGAQENSAIQAIVSKHNQEEIDKAKQSGAQIKF